MVLAKGQPPQTNVGKRWSIVKTPNIPEVGWGTCHPLLKADPLRCASGFSLCRELELTPKCMSVLGTSPHHTSWLCSLPSCASLSSQCERPANSLCVCGWPFRTPKSDADNNRYTITERRSSQLPGNQRQSERANLRGQAEWGKLQVMGFKPLHGHRDTRTQLMFNPSLCSFSSGANPMISTLRSPKYACIGLQP